MTYERAGFPHRFFPRFLILTPHLGWISLMRKFFNCLLVRIRVVDRGKPHLPVFARVQLFTSTQCYIDGFPYVNSGLSPSINDTTRTNFPFRQNA